MFSSERLLLVERYVEMLATAGVERGLIGPREAPRLWERHVFNCAALATLIETDSSVCDLGSGAGLPGLVLALARPDLEVTLVEPLLRRTTFLDEVVTELELSRVTVFRGRSEEVTGRRFDVVTARALAPLERLLGWAMPLVSPTGELLAMKGSTAAAEIEAAGEVTRLLRCREPQVEILLGADGSSTTTVVRVAHADPARVS